MAERWLDRRLEGDFTEVCSDPAILEAPLSLTLSAFACDSVDSIEKMKSQLPKLRKKLHSDPAYFKKVYGHVFTLSLAPGARTLALDQGEH